MTDTAGRSPGRPERELLADLHAGALDERDAAELRRRVQDDPDARAVLAALDATVAELAALPAPRMPGVVATRIEAALAAEARRDPAPPAADLASRRRRAAWAGAGLLAAAAAATVLALGGLQQETGDTPVVGPPTLALSDPGDGLDAALGVRDYGPLSRTDAVAACLRANGIAPAGNPLGSREVTLDGRRGILLVLPTGQIAQFRIVVVGPDCGPGNPSLLADDIVGR